MGGETGISIINVITPTELPDRELSSEEKESIFAKYTKHFNDFMLGKFKKEEKKGERDRKDYN